MMVLRRMGIVALAGCVMALPVVGAGCGQELDEEAKSGGEAEAAPAGQADDPGAGAPVYEPSGTAAWDAFDPEAELVGREALLDYLNDARLEHNLEPVTWDDTLQKAAEAHAKYIMQHKDAIDAADVSIHFEDESFEGFTGPTFVERGEAAGYPGLCFGEVVAFKPTAVGAARSWLESLYHRFPLLDAAAVHVGYAEAQLGPVRINVMEVGSHD